MYSQTSPEFTGFSKPIAWLGRYNFNGIREHIYFAGFADNLHEYLLCVNQVFDMVDRESTVREFGAAEQRLQVRTVKD